jgi:hypothetical protein
MQKVTTKTGFVYFFLDIGTKLVKIGYTNSESVNSRYASFKMHSPYGSKILGTIWSEDAIKLEKDLHTMFAEKRIGGEYFNIQEKDVNYCVDKFSKSNNDIDDICVKIKSHLSRLIETNTEEYIVFRSRINSLFVNKDEPEYNNHIISIMNQHFNTDGEGELVRLTCSEIKEQYFPNEYSLRQIGMCLKLMFNKKAKRVNGVVRQEYYLYKR